MTGETKMSFKEFKKKSKNEKTQTYKMKQLSSIIAVVGFVIVLVGFYLNSTSAQFNVVPFTIGVPIAVVGAILDVVSDKNLKKEYKEYLKQE